MTAPVARAAPRLCLNMIVRNEAENIERCLESVAPFIDYWVILDTGSTDDTPSRIERLFERNGIPGELCRSTFTDFSTSRNEALDLCRRSEAEFDYILLIDADMELAAQRADWPRLLELPAYSVRQVGGIAYDNVRLLRRDRDARYRGVTHEYLDTGFVTTRLDGLQMIDHASGGNRPGKAERDVALLQQGLLEEPDNARYMFYLAQSLKDAGRPEEALAWYRRRAEAGGWAEEQWYARYQAASCLFALGRDEEAVSAALQAWDERPRRLEPLALLTGHWRERAQYNLCCELAVLGRERPFPEQDRLFIEPDVYAWRFDQELAIAGFYATDPGHRQLGTNCCHGLAESRGVPPGVRHQARGNLKFYAHRAADWLGLEILAAYTAPGPQSHSSFNPSICSVGEQRALVLRRANYRLDGRRYVIDDPEGTITTQNFLLRLGDGFQPDDIRPIEPATGPDTPHLAPRHPFPVRGYEDLRLVRWRDRWWASATVRDTTPEGVCEMALLQLDEAGRILHETLLRGDWSGRHQKNWMPFVHRDDLHFVYGLDPVTILRYDERRDAVGPAAQSLPTVALEHLRGGGQLLPLDGEWLGVCHETTPGPDSPGAYLHRFFLLDEDFRLAALSDAFTFLGSDVEFCAGLAFEPATERLLLSFGVNDEQAVLGAMPLERVRQRLRRVT